MKSGRATFKTLLYGHEHVDEGALTNEQVNWDLWGDFTSAPGHW
jgi:hypothetical protein